MQVCKPTILSKEKHEKPIIKQVLVIFEIWKDEVSIIHKWVIMVLDFIVRERSFQGPGEQFKAKADNPCQISAKETVITRHKKQSMLN